MGNKFNWSNTKPNKTPRETSKEITEGKREPEHIGKKTGADLKQEFFSLMNESQAIMSEKETKEYIQKEKKLKKELEKEEEEKMKEYQEHIISLRRLRKSRK